MTDYDITDIDIDGAQLRKYIRQYWNTDGRERQREIESKVLAETVWQDPPGRKPEEVTVTTAEVERIYGELPEDAHDAKRILRASVLRS